MLLYFYSILFLLYRRDTINDKLLHYLLDFVCLSYIYYTTEYNFKKNTEILFVNQINQTNLIYK